jgi:hypothetical protein
VGLDGNGALANAGSALTTVTFSTPGAHQVSLRATDDDGVSASITIDVAAAPTSPTNPGPAAPAPPAPAPAPARRANTPPTCQSTTTTTTDPHAVHVQLRCSDAAHEALTYSIVAKPEHGALSAINQADGALTYTPHPGFHGTDSFSYAAASANGVSTAMRVIVNVKPGAPMLTHLAVSGVTSRKPNLDFRVLAATDAPALTTLTIELPRGLSFSRSDLSAGIVTTGEAGKRPQASRQSEPRQTHHRARP